MERLLKQIEAYKPCNEQEEKDRELLIQWIRSGRDIVTRANETAHLTASAWVVSPDRKNRREENSIRNLICCNLKM